MHTRLRFLALVAALLLLSLPLAAQVEPLGGELHLNAAEEYQEKNPSAFYRPDGGFTVVWENVEMGLRGRRFDRDGRPLGGNLSLVDNDRLAEVPGSGPIVYRSQPATLALPSGDFLLFWTEEEAIYYVYYFQVWRDVQDRNVWGQRFDARGRPVGQRFRVNQQQAGFQTRPAAALAPGGRVLVAWEGAAGGPAADGVFARLLTARGVPLSQEIQLAGAGSYRPAVAANAEGRFLVAWESCCGDGDDKGVFAALLDRQGNSVGPVFQVNTATWGPQRRPAVATDPWSNFMVVWQGRHLEPRHARIFAQAVGRDGTLLGPELRISEGVGTTQISPALVPTERGGFFVFWLDWVENFPVGVFGVEIDAFGVSVSDETLISQAQVGAQHQFVAVSDGHRQALVSWQGFQGEELGVMGQRLVLGPPAQRTLGIVARP